MREKTNLSSIAIHDLRNYISGINGLSNVILECINVHKIKLEQIGVESDHNFKELYEFITMLSPYSKEALEYFEDLLKSNNASNENKKFCKADKVIEELLIFNGDFIRQNLVQISLEIDRDIPIIYCDSIKLKVALTNLILNAVKYSYENSVVKIRVYSQNNSVIFEIIDHGIGMDDIELRMALSGKGAEIAKPQLKKEFDSCGLGMLSVQEMMKEINAKFKIESKKNEGTRACIELSAG